MYRAFLDKIVHLSWPLIGLVFVLSSVGFLMLYSAAEGNVDPWAWKQMVRFAVFFPVMIAIAIIDIRVWLKYAYVLYAVFLIALILLVGTSIGTKAMGATRWLTLGPFTVQPSEMMKVFMVLALARYFHTVAMQDIGRVLYLIVPIGLVCAPCALTYLQPDLGTAIILLMVGGFVFFAAGVRLWKFAVVVVGGGAAIPFLWPYLHDYQKARVTGFLYPERDPLGSGYNILQSKIAIGSGGLTGKGFLQGTQSQLSFLPEKQTDFVFTMLAEEFGMMGGVVILFLYFLIIAYGLLISMSCKHFFGKILCVGISSMVFLHVFINIAMVMGMIPVVGAPLPFLSYGGTIMLTILVAYGLVLNVHLHRSVQLDRNFGSRL